MAPAAHKRNATHVLRVGPEQGPPMHTHLYVYFAQQIANLHSSAFVERLHSRSQPLANRALHSLLSFLSPTCASLLLRLSSFRAYIVHLRCSSLHSCSPLPSHRARASNPKPLTPVLSQLDPFIRFSAPQFIVRCRQFLEAFVRKSLQLSATSSCVMFTQSWSVSIPSVLAFQLPPGSVVSRQ